MGVACELWVGLQASMKCVGGDCVTHVHAGVGPGVVAQSDETWARASSCKPSVTSDALNNIALTSYYARYLNNPPMEV